MRKLIIPIALIIIITGCSKGAMSGYLERKCEKKENINNVTVIKKININYKDNKIQKIKYMDEYSGETSELDLIKNSKISENNIYKSDNGIKIENTFEENKYIFSYDINLEETKKENIERLKIQIETNKEINELKDNGYSCN